MFNIQSNMLRGSYMRDIVDRTVKEIHDDVVTVFGPFATDAYLNKDGHPYYTRDGKETVQSMTFDNELSMYILKMIFQAISDQASKVGDGTTTLAVLYTNLYRQLRFLARQNCDENEEDNGLPSREDWKETMKILTARIKKRATPLKEKDLIQMLYTCTQDEELAAKIMENLGEAIMNNAYIIINKADADADFSMTTHTNPLIKATRQFSVFPMHTTERCTILHCNGVLDIVHPETFIDLMGYVGQSEGPSGVNIFHTKTIVILCNGTTEKTRSSVKALIQKINQVKETNPDIVNTLNNLAIYTLDDYRSYDNEQIEDISTIITDENGIGGLVNQLTFESLIYQTLHSPNDPKIPDLETFDCDIHNIDKMRLLMESDPYEVDFDDMEGMRIKKSLGPVAKARYDALRKQISEEKSPVKRVNLTKRLRTMYGQFIEVSVGSRLLKDSQRKYELILDAVLSSSEAAEKGILHANSIAVAMRESALLHNKLAKSTDKKSQKIAWCNDILYNALRETMYDMFSNGFYMDNIPAFYDILDSWIMHGDLKNFNLHRNNLNEALPMPGEKHKPIVHNVTITNIDNDKVHYQFAEEIVEPASIITTMLENSTLMLELATAKTFHVAGFMQNYIK